MTAVKHDNADDVFDACMGEDRFVAKALDALVHRIRTIVLVKTNTEGDNLTLLDGYAIIGYTLLGEDFQPAWSMSIVKKSQHQSSDVFFERVDALHAAIQQGFRYIH